MYPILEVQLFSPEGEIIVFKALRQNGNAIYKLVKRLHEKGYIVDVFKILYDQSKTKIWSKRIYSFPEWEHEDTK